VRSIRIVLVRPRNPNNIGAAARAMANFDLEDLAVVDPYEAVWRETQAAVGGEEVMRNARKLAMPEALADCHLVIGATTGRRRMLDIPMVTLPALGGFLEKRLAGSGRTAIMFGSEKTGLGNEELSRCHAWLNIPTSARAPSMNLGQAVAVISYELSRSGARKSGLESIPRPPAARQLEDLMERTLDVFQYLEYKKRVPRKSLETQLRQSILHWNMTRKDAALLQALFKRIGERLKNGPTR
jgi:TrmH family RNA methyltransferase